MTVVQKNIIAQVFTEKVESFETTQELRDFIETLRNAEMDELADEYEFITLPEWEAQNRNFEN